MTLATTTASPATATATSTTTTTTTTTTSLPEIEKLSVDEVDEALLASPSLTPIEQLYDLCRRNEPLEAIVAAIEERRQRSPLDVNEILQNGDTLLCLACNKGLDALVRHLVEHCSADVNLCRRTLNNNNHHSHSSSYSSSHNGSASAAMPTISISTRRYSRLLTSSASSGSLSTFQMSANSSSSSSSCNSVGDSPLAICIKYGFEAIGEYLIDHSADIMGSQAQMANNTGNSSGYADFERSPLQEAIRLNRSRTIERMLAHIFDAEDVRSVEWLFAKRYDILRQCLMTESESALRIMLPNLLANNGRVDGEMLVHILNSLLMKSKIQERKEKINRLLEIVMEIGTGGGGQATTTTTTQFEIANLDVFVRGFLATLKALFNVVSSEDSRTSILTYRTSLFFAVLKYQKAIEHFEPFYADIDATFDFFYTKMKETGENVLKLVEYFITFYDTLITMRHIRLTAANVIHLLRLEHVKKLDILGEFLIQRSLIPLDLKELARIKIKSTMPAFSREAIEHLPLVDQYCKDYLYFV